MMSSIVCCSVANFAPEIIEYYFFPEKSKTPMPACFYVHSECLGALLDSIDIHSDPSMDHQLYNFKFLYARKI